MLFTFPSRYWFTIGRCCCLALEGGPPSFPQAFSWLVVLRYQSKRLARPRRDSHPLWSGVPNRFVCACCFLVTGPTTPAWSKPDWFGLGPVRSPLLRASRLISFRQATEMFQFTHVPPPRLCVQRGVSRHDSGWVAPFGYSGLIACMQLPLNVSPVSASFFGQQRQGIHRVLLVTCAPQVAFDLVSDRLVSRCVLCFNSCWHVLS